ncbi:hypothetical protein FACS189442_6300 [Spirochaetia bacterium]|nr:hypothetical protein FACS189442_6300 [Spirochaetia bacterium]
MGRPGNCRRFILGTCIICDRNRVPRIRGAEPPGDQYPFFGNWLGIISGIDDQRFLLLEHFGLPGSGEYKAGYHEFLEDGFRRAVRISFIDNDSRIAFERQGGLGIYEINNRISRRIPLEGEIAALDAEGSGGLLFVIISQSELQKRLIAISLPGTIIMEAPFKSDAAFLGRRGSRLYLGGGSTLASFELGKK